MTDWNLAAKIFFGIAIGCVVLVTLVTIARSKGVWSFVAWAIKGIWNRLVDGTKFIFSVVMNLVIIFFVSSLIFIVLLIPLSLLNPQYKPDIGEGVVWVALAYLLYRVKKLEDRLKSLQPRDQLDKRNDPLDNPPR